jgi:hypothetical protein
MRYVGYMRALAAGLSHFLGWPDWKRRHQARARRFHYQHHVAYV